MTVKKYNKNVFTYSHLKLVIRLGLFVWAFILYALPGGFVNENALFLTITGGLFVLEMLSKLFPLKIESMGSQKQFGKNFAPTKDKVKAEIKNGKRALFIALLWVILNAFVAQLYFKHIIDTGIMILISLFYSVCDMICVLFYCPFQHIMRNKCCTTCRIHNWDYVMMFTPMAFVDSIFANVLFWLGLLIFIRWEYTVWKHPERFCEKTNINLSCASCTETRCSRKGMKNL